MGTDVSAEPSVDRHTGRAMSAPPRLVFLDNLRALALGVSALVLRRLPGLRRVF